MKISIITVVKNGMPFLKDAIKSFELQKYRNKELIIVYSKSIDETENYINSLSKKNYKIVGKYDESYRIAGDFDFFARAIKNNNIKFKYINLIIARMQTGGLSGLNFKSYITSTKEILKSFLHLVRGNF